MRKTSFALLVAACVLTSLLSALAASAKIQPVNSDEPSAQKQGPQLPPEEIIRQFTKKESELREIWKEYSYVQESKLQVLGPADTISGEYYQVSEFVFNDAGQRLERIVKAPPSTLDQAGLRMTAEDKNAFINLQPFALSAEDLPNYYVSYIGKEKIDELNTYVFDVIPKVMSNQRDLDRLRKQKIEGKFFQGKIWVDDQDLQIVKTAGKTVPEFEQRFPKFETYRENIDERFWFPTYTYGLDNLEFDRFRIRVRMIIKYKNYRRFSSDVKILGVEEVKEEQPAPGAKPDEAKTGETKPGEGKPSETKKDETKKGGVDKPKQRPRP
ncbi:MAG: hypothetical protein AB7U82_19065 [Blastocatellales bacterium]